MVKFVSTKNPAVLIFIASWQSLLLCKKKKDTRCRVLARDIVAGIATSYGLGAAEKANLVGLEVLRTRPDRPWGPPSLLYGKYRVSFPGVKRPGRGFNHPRPSSAKVNP